MTEIFRARIERDLIAGANKVAEEIGTTSQHVVRMLFTQMIKRRTIPFPLSADALEDEIFTSAKRRNKLADEF